MKPSELPDIGNRICVFDTETSGLHFDDGRRVSVVSVAWLDDSDTVVGYAFPFDQGWLDKQAQGMLFEDLPEGGNLPAQEWQALLAWLRLRRLCAHNAKFDLHMMRVGTRHWAGTDLSEQVVWDTILVAKELDPTKPTGLEPVGRRMGLQSGKSANAKAIAAYLKHRKVRKAVGSDTRGRYDLVPWSILGPYAAEDATDDLLIYLDQRRRLAQGEGEMRTVRRELEMMKVLYRMEMRGIGLDVGAAVTGAGILLQAQERIKQELPFAPTKAAAIRWFFETQGQIPSETTPTGQIQLTERVVENLAARDVPGARLYADYRKIDVMLSMWYDSYATKTGADGRLRTSYRQTKEAGEGGGGTVSGRFSVERINLQAIPHKSKLEGALLLGGPELMSPRSLFVAKSGYELWEADLQQAEARSAAKLAGCDAWLQMIDEKIDMHGATAVKLFDTTENEADWFKMRQVAKRANFSLIFGVGWFTFRQTLIKELGIDLPEYEVKRIVADWRALYPEFQRAIYRCQRQAERKGWVPLVGGGRRHFWPGEPEHKAFNQQVQGSLAEFAKRWAIETDRSWPGRLVLLIHDSEVMECEIGEGEHVMAGVAAVGSEMGTRFFEVPFGVDYGLFQEH